MAVTYNDVRKVKPEQGPTQHVPTYEEIRAAIDSGTIPSNMPQSAGVTYSSMFGTGTPITTISGHVQNNKVLYSGGTEGDGESTPKTEFDTYYDAAYAAEKYDFNKLAELYKTDKDEALGLYKDQYDAAIAANEDANRRAAIDARAAYDLAGSRYGTNAEVMAGKGLTGSGYADYLKSKNYATYRSEVANAQRAKEEADAKAKTTYDTGVAEVNADYKTAMAELASAKAKAAAEGYTKYTTADGGVNLAGMNADWKNMSPDEQAAAREQAAATIPDPENAFTYTDEDRVGQQMSKADAFKELDERKKVSNDIITQQEKDYMEELYDAIYTFDTLANDSIGELSGIHTNGSDDVPGREIFTVKLGYSAYSLRLEHDPIADTDTAYMVLKDAPTNKLLSYDGKLYVRVPSGKIFPVYNGADYSDFVNALNFIDINLKPSVSSLKDAAAEKLYGVAEEDTNK